MKKFIPLLLILILCASCESTTNKTITIPDRFTLDIPSFLEEQSDLNEEASLQYGDVWKEFYVIVIEETKQEMEEAFAEMGLGEVLDYDLDGYSELVLDGFMSDDYQSEADTTINQMPATVKTFYQDFEDITTYFTVAVVESERSYYQIMTWTLSENESKYDERMSDIVYSLKELE